jgi:hypothetical protein
MRLDPHVKTFEDTTRKLQAVAKALVWPISVDAIGTPGAPTDAELDGMFGQPANMDAPAGLLDAGGAGTDVLLAIPIGSEWYYVGLTKAV